MNEAETRAELIDPMLAEMNQNEKTIIHGLSSMSFALSAVEKTFLSILYSCMISKPPPTPDVERTGMPARLIESTSR